ncbi:hypothetical protein H6F93_14695 [Leptolyngbya sp. FACHB-671]|nr:hypothetical protein [Leptolyngbya sp. FACHB-671]
MILFKYLRLEAVLRLLRVFLDYDALLVQVEELVVDLLPSLQGLDTTILLVALVLKG